MRSGRLFLKLFLINAAVVTFVLAACVGVIIYRFEALEAKELTEQLRAQASALRAAVSGHFREPDADALARMADEIGADLARGMRVTFIAADGTVLGDSAEDPQLMELHDTRPEVREAMARGWGERTRWSTTVGMRLKYVATRVGPADHPLGIVRVAMAVRAIGARTAEIRHLVVTIAAASALGGVLLAMGLAMLWSRRIERITAAARCVSRGELSSRIDVRGRDEVAMLARSLDRMRERLARQLETIDRQRRTLDSLVSQLHEGVILVDRARRIVLINAEAVRLLGMDETVAADSFAGMPIEDWVHEHRLLRMLDQGDGQAESKDLPSRPREARLQVRTSTGSAHLLVRAFDIQLPPGGAGMDAANGVTPGRLVVLTDVTELTRIMQMKSDFAANASHELRTPLTAIRAALDTLRSTDFTDDQERAVNFLSMIERHTHRMEAMVSDLLDLSRLESPTARFEPAPVRAYTLLDDLQGSFSSALESRNIRWETQVAPDAQTLVVNRDLLRIILRNLIENAIRFTDPGGWIRVSVGRRNGQAVIEVADNGCGIPKDQQERVFERFYQVNRARSGGQRGTGLGLSIVRHAAAAMGGQVSLESEVGQGTRVSVMIPQAARLDVSDG